MIGMEGNKIVKDGVEILIVMKVLRVEIMILKLEKERDIEYVKI